MKKAKLIKKDIKNITVASNINSEVQNNSIKFRILNVYKFNAITF